MLTGALIRLFAQGWPIFLLAEASLHTQNIKANSRVSLLCQTPTEANGQPVRDQFDIILGLIQKLKRFTDELMVSLDMNKD